MTDKIYYPEVVETITIPGVDTPDYSAKGDSGKSTDYAPDQIYDPLSFPVTAIARELLSVSLNTKSKKILGEYSLGAMGAIAIGKYESGVSGDIRITPDGITARNSSGATTFSLDGDTGDASFAGTLSAASGALGAITIGSNAWHVDVNGNMWWGNFATYALATIKISSAGAINFTTGNFSGTLSSPSGTLGTITAGTITGATFKTKSSGVRVQLDANNATVSLYDSGDDLAGRLDDSGTNIFLASYDSRGLQLIANSGSGTISINAGTIDVNNAAMTNVGNVSGVNSLALDGDIDMNGNDANEMGIISFNTRSSNPGDDWCIYAYDSGGKQQLRVRLNGTTYAATLESP